ARLRSGDATSVRARKLKRDAETRESNVGRVLDELAICGDRVSAGGPARSTLVGELVDGEEKGGRPEYVDAGAIGLRAHDHLAQVITVHVNAHGGVRLHAAGERQREQHRAYKK